LTRGTTIYIPSPTEIQQFKDTHKTPPVTSAASIPIERRKAPRSEATRASVQQFIQQLGESTRIVRRTVSGAFNSFTIRLDVLHEGTWTQVLAYDIKLEGSIRHEYSITGTTHSTTIDLPTEAAKEMAETDISTNWKSYTQSFLSNRTLA